MPTNNHDCPCQFPSQISVVCAVDLAQHIIAGEVDPSNWGHLGRHAACLLGSIANQFENPPLFDTPESATAFSDPKEAAQYVVDNAPMGAGEDSSFGEMNPLLWAALKMVLATAFDKLREYLGL